MFGDWSKAAKVTGSMQQKWEAASKRAVLQEAHYLRGQIVTGLRDGSPGGETFKPLSPITLATRAFAGFKGTKPLVRKADMRNAIAVTNVPGGVFVGILRSAKSADGKELHNIAEMHENGAGPIVIPITPKSRRFYFAALAHAGIDPPASAGGHGPGLAVAIVRIPARPFMGPVFRKDGKPELVRVRFFRSVSQAMGGALGTP